MTHHDIDICVCTFRRPHLAQTLKSLSRLTLTPGRNIRLIVADNDDVPSARELAQQTASECHLALTYIHAPARNISIARNACLDAGTAPIFAFLDDDELAATSWLEAMISALETTQADIILGPVKALYDETETPQWISTGDFHSARPVWVQGEIRTGYSCNVLIRRAAVTGLRFREEFGRSGGEDTIFFASAFKAGARFAYAPEAVVTESVPAGRASFSWLLKRAFRSGQTHAVLLMEGSAENPAARIKSVVVALAKMFFCLMTALLVLIGSLFAVTLRVRRWVLRGALHAGVVSRFFGKRELVQYGQSHDS